MTNFVKLASALDHQAQALLAVNRALMKYPKDKDGNYVVPKASMGNLVRIIRKAASLSDRVVVELERAR
jgi:hypothetical protein